MKINAKLITIVITLVILGYLTFRFTYPDWQSKLVGSDLTTSSSNLAPSPTAEPKPKTFQFDSSTDLEKELEKIDPKVLDSDFE